MCGAIGQTVSGRDRGEEDDACRGRGRVDRREDRGGRRRDDEDDVRSAGGRGSGPFGDAPGGGVDDGIEAELAGEPAPDGVGVAPEEEARPGEPREPAEEEAVRAEADHEHRVARADEGPVHRLQGARDGLDERAAREGDVRREEEGVARDGRGRDPHVLGEASRVEAGRLPLRAHHRLPRGAEATGAARGVVVDEDAVSRLQVRHAGARLDDDAGGLVPEDGRGLRRDVPGVDVAPAETDGLHGDEDLAGAGPGRLHLDDLDPPRGAGERRFHRGRDHGRNATFMSSPPAMRAKTAAYPSSGLSPGHEVLRRDLAPGEKGERFPGLGRRVVEGADEAHLVVVDPVRQDREPRLVREAREEEDRPAPRREGRCLLRDRGVARRLDHEVRAVAGGRAPRILSASPSPDATVSAPSAACAASRPAFRPATRTRAGSPALQEDREEERDRAGAEDERRLPRDVPDPREAAKDRREGVEEGGGARATGLRERAGARGPRCAPGRGRTRPRSPRRGGRRRCRRGSGAPRGSRGTRRTRRSRPT